MSSQDTNSTLGTGASCSSRVDLEVRFNHAAKGHSGPQWFANSNSSSGNDIEYKRLFQEAGQPQLPGYSYKLSGGPAESQYSCLNLRHSMSNLLAE
jgi:hypothetical protein